MYLNELDNFHFDLPDLGTAPQVAVPNAAPDELDLSALPIPTTSSPVGTVDAPQIGSLSAADEELFRGVIAKYFSDEKAPQPPKGEGCRGVSLLTELTSRGQQGGSPPPSGAGGLPSLITASASGYPKRTSCETSTTTRQTR